ncbi:mitofilin family membrane protein [Brucella sp. BE17]|uniref:COG4223 family protein n=1 Tax=Brucella sp. BE17 TaxID=3142977 RepID=UPI0031BAD750
MAKSGTPRHSKPARNPVTINLDSSEVKRINEPDGSKTTPAAEPVGPIKTKDVGKDNGAEKVAGAEKSSGSSAKPPFTAGVKPEKEKPRVTDGGISSSMPPPPSSAQKSGIGASHLLAGIAGGVIALGGMALLQWAGVLPSSGGRVTPEQLSQVEKQIADLRDNPAPAPLDAESKTELAQLQKNVEAAEIKSEAAVGELTKLQQQIAASTSEGVAPAEIEALTGRLDALDKEFATARERVDQAASAVSGNDGALSALESKLVALEEKIGEASRQPDMAALIAANALKTAIDRGGSFKTELDTFASLAPQDNDVEVLRSFAEKGLPTVAELNSRFGDVANRIVATENKLPADAGVFDHLMASAKGLVAVRPVAGDVEGEGVGPTTARMEAALNKGDLERAIAEWEQLPADAKATSKEFADQLKARRDADAVIQRLVTQSLTPKAPADASGGAVAPAAN